MSVIVITGASRGIGAATARAAAKRGYAVAVNYISNTQAADSVVADITGAGGKAIAVQADVSTEAGVKMLFETVDESLGKITALFANAGIIHNNCSILDYDAATLEQLWRVNITGQFLSCREAVRRMSDKHGGTGGAIVINSSAAARLGGGPLLAYAASKGASDTLTTGLTQEVAKYGIRVNAIRPGLIETEIHDGTGDMNRLNNLVGGVPMGRTGSADEVADSVMWLLSDDASYVTGTFVDVSGGR